VKAAVIRQYGGPEVLQIDEMPEPVLGPRDLLIEVHAAGVNPIDTKMRSGAFRGAVRWKLPWILGLDVSGVVREVGSGVTKFAAGDEIYASTVHTRPGCYAERVAIDERICARKPKNVTHEEAAGLPMTTLTAWESLVTKAKLRAGQKCLVQAGAGGVGIAAIQIAKHLGAHVATTCSAKNIELVKSLGADLAIDYHEQRVEDVVKDYDVAIDAITGDRSRTLSTLRNGGFLVNLNSGIPENVKKHGPILGLAAAIGDSALFTIGTFLTRRVLVSHVLRPADGAMLEKITELVEAGAVRPVNDSVFPLEKVSEAHARSESGHARGKIVVAVQRSS
jgi:NADPH:quinone reductase-like Zn-dependent oxidoreductase